MSSLATQSSSVSSSTPSPAASTFSSSRTFTRSISSINNANPANNNNDINCNNNNISHLSTPPSYLDQSSASSGYSNYSATMVRKPRRTIDRNKRATISSPIGFRRDEPVEMPSPKPKKSLPNFSISPYTEAPPRDVLYNTEF